MGYKNISLEKQGEIAILKMNTPYNENRLTMETCGELLVAVEEIQNDTDIRVVIYTGEGDFFIRGADAKSFIGYTPMQGEYFASQATKLCTALEKLDKVVIAAMKNTVFGGGMEVALACDLRILADNTQLCLPETRLGVIAGGSSHQRLPRLVGNAKALEFLLARLVVDAEEAYRLGLANKVVPLDKLMDAAFEMAQKVLECAPWATVFSKRAVINGRDMEVDKALAHDNTLFGMCFATGESEEALDAYFAGREPNFEKGLKPFK